MRCGLRVILSLVLVTALSGAAASARQTPAEQIRATFAAGAPGARLGLVVADETGREILAIAPDERFMPASNTKLLTTAAAFETLAVDAPDSDGGAEVRLEPDGRGPPDVVLVGHGGARLSSAADCAVDCLAALADAVAAKTRVVDDVIGDASAYPDERWSPGMSWNNIPTRSGTGVAALSLDDNELHVTVSPDAVPAAPLPYYRIASVVRPGDATEIVVERLPGSDAVRLEGTIARGAPPELVRLGIDDPARYAAWRLAALLRARGVRVKGEIGSRYQPSGQPPAGPVLARTSPLPLAADLVIINKLSQNLHAELLLRRLGAAKGTGAIADGVAVIGDMLARAGVPSSAWHLSDGSGMSSYNRVSPRAMVRLLRWGAARPWGPAWRATFPVAGVDGTLRNRFVGTPLQGRLTAKTGTLNATNALAGMLTAASGRTLTFAAYANDVPEGVDANAAIDAALLRIAAAN